MLGKDLSSVLKTKGIFAFSILLFIVSIISILIPYQTGIFIDAIVNKNNVIFAFVLLVIFGFAQILLRRIIAFFAAKISRAKEIQLQGEYLARIAAFSPFDLEKFPNGELGLKFLRDIQNLTQLLKSLYPQFVEIFFGTIFALSFVFYKNYIIGFVFLLIIPVNFLAILPYFRIFEKINSIYRKMNDGVYSKIFEFFYNIAHLKCISAVEFYKKDSQKKLANIAKFNYINFIYEANFSWLINAFLFFGEFSILAIASYWAYQGKLQIGEVIFYQFLFVSTFNSFSNMYRLLPSWALVKESLLSLGELDKNVEENFYGDAELDFNGNIRLDKISFSYGGTKIFSDFSLDIKAGDFVLVEGENGAGKTTLLKIVSAYLVPQQGRVLFDETDSKKINLQKLRESISVVSQNFLLITDTIKNNITLHSGKYTDEEISEVVSLVGLDSLIQKLKMGLDEKVGNDGVKLSGGEMQKVAIARALIRKPKLLILDEISNHLDAQSRESIMQIIAKLKGKTTIIFVSHNKQTNLNFDKTVSL